MSRERRFDSFHPCDAAGIAAVLHRRTHHIRQLGEPLTALLAGGRRSGDLLEQIDAALLQFFTIFRAGRGQPYVDFFHISQQLLHLLVGRRGNRANISNHGAVGVEESAGNAFAADFGAIDEFPCIADAEHRAELHLLVVVAAQHHRPGVFIDQDVGFQAASSRGHDARSNAAEVAELGVLGQLTPGNCGFEFLRALGDPFAQRVGGLLFKAEFLDVFLCEQKSLEPGAVARSQGGNNFFR